MGGPSVGPSIRVRPLIPLSPRMVAEDRVSSMSSCSGRREEPTKVRTCTWLCTLEVIHDVDLER
jgi:hypothetical protein